MKFILSTVLLLSFEGLIRSEESCVTVKTEYGLVCGARKNATNGKEFISFLGIPYAKAPTGKLRFAEPQSPEPYEGVFNATKQGPICPQRLLKVFTSFMSSPNVSEDCLRINVYAPLANIPDPNSNETRSKLPVFFFIHGGSFGVGSGYPDTYGPEFIVSRDVVMVTINYRLGPLGFLNLNNKYCPGNAGLRDALFALQWVQRNIASMGGDPARVTVAGQSAGAVMAHLLSISPATKDRGLFQNVICMSGSALANFFTIAKINTVYMATRFLEGMGISPLQSPEQIHKALSEASLEKILNASDYVQTKAVLLTFVPSIDEPQEGFTQMVPKNPEHLIDEGYGKEHNMLFSFTSSECNVFRPLVKNFVPLLNLLPMSTVPQNLLLTGNPLMVPALIHQIYKEYYDNKPFTIDEYAVFSTDSIFKYPAMRSIDKRIAIGAAPSYVAQFSVELNENNPLKEILGYTWTNVSHAEDLLYLFRLNSIMPPTDDNELEQNDVISVTRKFMTNIVTTFVRTGSPGDEDFAWPPVDKEPKFVDIVYPQPQCKPYTPYLNQRRTFFNKLYRLANFTIFH